MRGKGGARRPGLLAPHFLAVSGVNLLGLVAQSRDLFLRKAAGQEQITFFRELPKLLSRQLHRGFLSLTWTTCSVDARFRRRRGQYVLARRARRSRHPRRGRSGEFPRARPTPADAVPYR